MRRWFSVWAADRCIYWKSLLTFLLLDSRLGIFAICGASATRRDYSSTLFTKSPLWWRRPWISARIVNICDSRIDSFVNRRPSFYLRRNEWGWAGPHSRGRKSDVEFYLRFRRFCVMQSLNEMRRVAGIFILGLKVTFSVSLNSFWNNSFTCPSSLLSKKQGLYLLLLLFPI